jgi:phage N-6-adenine-methyltransferase
MIVAEKKKKNENSSGDEYGTPWPVFEKFDCAFHFDVDVCCTAKNTKIPKKYFTKAENGLWQPWYSYGKCWMNPPYSDVSPWLIKAKYESELGALVAALLRHDSSAAWYHDLVLTKAKIAYLRGRLSHIEEDGSIKNSSPFGSIVAFYCNDEEYFHKTILTVKGLDVEKYLMYGVISIDCRQPRIRKPAPEKKTTTRRRKKANAEAGS